MWPFLIVISAVFALPPERPSYFWSTRSLSCEHQFGNITRCSLRQQGHTAELNPECFDEVDSKNETRVYCRIGCEESDETTLLYKKPQWNHQCNMFYTYNIERRRHDWFLWRSGSCLETTIHFEVRCGQPRDPRVFYRENAKLFEYEDAVN